LCLILYFETLQKNRQQAIGNTYIITQFDRV